MNALTFGCRLVRGSLLARSNSVKKIASEAMPGSEERLIWMDLEMTGLDVESDKILEIACLVTDEQLQVIGDGVDVIIHQPKEILDQMNEWCKENHGKSGLTSESLNSGVTIEMAESRILAYVRKHTVQGKSPLAGNTIYMDRRFIEKYMPELQQHLHYRIVDVSSVKELCSRWFPSEFRNAPKKRFMHRALDDIRSSIAELDYYRNAIFKQ